MRIQANHPLGWTLEQQRGMLRAERSLEHFLKYGRGHSFRRFLRSVPDPDERRELNALSIHCLIEAFEEMRPYLPEQQGE